MSLLHFTLVMVIFSIFVVFSQELMKALLKFFCLPGTRLVLPLCGITYGLIYFEYWTTWFLLMVKYSFHFSVEMLASLEPFQSVPHSGSIVLLCCMTILPSWLFSVFYVNQTYRSFTGEWFMLSMLWVFWSILIIF